MSLMDGLHSIQLILPDEILSNAWISFASGKISGFGVGKPTAAGVFLDGENHYVAPGFIDMHVHGGNGADFLDVSPEAYHRISAFHLAGGTTAVCPTIATTSQVNMETALGIYRQARESAPGRLLPMHFEGPYLARNKAGAQDPALIRDASDADIDWLVDNAADISQVTIAPELPNSLALIERVSKAGICASLGHTETTSEQASRAVAAGARKVTHLYNAMSSAAKQGLFRYAGLLEYALTEERLFCELIGDGFHVTPVLARLAYRAKGPERLALVSDALAGAGLPLGTTFPLANLRCRVAEGFCTLADGSALSGSATRLIDHIRTLVQKVQLPLAAAVRMAAQTPAEVLGLNDSGKIDVGLRADLVRFNGQFQVLDVWRAGQKMVAAK